MSTRLSASVRALLLLLLVSPAWAAGEAGPGAGSDTRAVLVASDFHFDPTADPKIVPMLSQQPVSAWSQLLAPSATASVPGQGKDSNWALLSSAIDAMKIAAPAPDVILLPGDFLAHHLQEKFFASIGRTDPGAYADFATKTFEFIVQTLHSRFPDAVIAPVLGNNDSLCGDYGAQQDGPIFGATTGQVVALSKNRLDPDQIKQWSALGAYRMTLDGPLRILAFDDDFVSTHYTNPCGEDDPGTHLLDWLATELQQAEAAKSKVWLLYHIPSGIDAFATLRQTGSSPEPSCPTPEPMWRPDYEARFEALTARYHDTIVASFAGHTHMDEFRLTKSNGQIVGLTLQTPAISPIFGQNPAFRIVTAGKDGALVDTKIEYLANLADAQQGAVPLWKAEYDFAEAWKLPDVDPTSLDKLDKQIDEDPAVRSRWEQFYGVSRAKAQITAENFRAYYCSIDNGTAEPYSKCACPATQQ
jgi:hypothetical protein